jgi:hypothetical protein
MLLMPPPTPPPPCPTPSRARTRTSGKSSRQTEAGRQGEREGEWEGREGREGWGQEEGRVCVAETNWQVRAAVVGTGCPQRCVALPQEQEQEQEQEEQEVCMSVLLARGEAGRQL